MSKIHFEKLTPIKDVDLKVYKEALDFVFGNNEIKNIAITGSYSAGKSSVVESYKKYVSDKKFLHISLANFERYDQVETKEDSRQEQEEKNNDIKSYIKESVLEGKILNQLLHQIDTSKIPQTNFKIKTTVSDKDIIKTTAIIIAFIVSGLHLRYHKEWISFIDSLNQFYSLRFIKITTKGISLFFSGVIFSTVFIILIFNLVKMQKNKSIFKKLNFNGNEIEIFEKNDESYFDKYLNEVLYIFENCDVDVIVFEDIDRYNMNEIFQRLREINTLVNSKRVTSNKEPLRFFYLIRDDIFMSKDRTKFFDFIMPVVPIIDGSNSYDQFIDHFKKGNILDKFDEHFLQGISLYVDDMRILKNIYNEFIIYYNRIGTTEQDYNKLLAMIVYKNIFPRDFSETQINIGFVSTIFEKKDEIIKDQIDKINAKMHELEQLIISYNEEHLKNIDELKKVYSDFSWHPPQLDKNNPEYIDRTKIIELNKDNKVNGLKDEINKLNKDKINLKNEKLARMITRENVDKVFDIRYENFLGENNDFNEIKSSQYFDLIKYLIWNGYIDETYTDYMTYFYPNSLSRNDKMFLRSITDKKAKEWSYNLENPKLVLSRLKDVDFDEIETLNFNLFEYLLQTQSENKKYLDIFVNQLKENRQFKFMEGYFNYTNNLTRYVKVINKYWPSFLEEINSCPEFTYKEIKEYILQTLYHSDKVSIDNINKDDFLSKLISSDKMFLNIEKPNIEKLIEEFQSLNIKFETLDFEQSHKELFDSVYENKLYKLNYENIWVILKYIFKVENDDDIKNKNYSLIIENSNSKLHEYINENIQTYMEVVIDKCYGKILDTQEAALKLINNNNIDVTQIKEYIMSLNTELTLLEDIEDKELWRYILQNQKVKYSIENILHYYFVMNKTLDETLINFINSDKIEDEFSEEYIDEQFGDGSAQNIFESIAICEDIEKENYKTILKSLKFIYPTPEPEIQDLPKERIEILVELDKFEVTSQNIEFLQENYENLFLVFIEKNIEEYVDGIEDLPKLKKHELIALLSTKIEDKFKIKLIYNYDDSISISQLNCSDYVKNFIINNNFDESELKYIISTYESSTDSIKETIINICEKYIDIIVSDKIDINYNLFINILSRGNITSEIKLQLLNNHIGRLSKLQVHEAVRNIGLNEHEKVFTNGRPKIEVNDVNREFLSKCKNKKWISNFYEDEGVFKISRRGLVGNN